MAVTISGDDVTWGMSAETGALPQSARITRRVDEKRYRNNEGEVSSHVVYNPHAEWNIEFYPTATTGISAIAPGVAQTIANITETGLEIPLEVNIELTNEEAKRISASGVSHPLVTS